MSQDVAVVRQEHIQGLAQFCAALADAVNSAAAGDRTCRQAVEAALTAECVQCGLRMTGSELLSLGEADPPGNPNAKLCRLRQGYCARNGCDSYYYRLTFETHPEVDWAELLSQSASRDAMRLEETGAEIAATKATRRAARRRLAGRIAAGLLVVGAAWLIRQWYLGGTIPFLREPEHFQVDRIEPSYPGLGSP